MALRYGRSRLPELLGGMPQTELARRAGVSDGLITQVIQGKSRLSLLKAKEIANVLGCYVDDLYEWENVPYEGKRRE